MTARCPSDLALEAYLLTPEGSPLVPHLDGCEACRARVARMREEGEDFRRFVFPATVEKVEEAAVRRPFRLGFFLGPVGAVAALAAALLLFVRTQQGPPSPDSGYVGLKGGLALAVYVNGDGGAHPVEDGAVVPAAAALRFQVSPANGCYLWIMSVDAQGTVSRLYPPEGRPAEARGPGAVPGGAVLDGTAGPERIFAVCAPPSMAWSEVRSAAPAKAGADAVRASRALGGPLAQASQSTLLLEKRP